MVVCLRYYINPSQTLVLMDDILSLVDNDKVDDYISAVLLKELKSIRTLIIWQSIQMGLYDEEAGKIRWDKLTSFVFNSFSFTVLAVAGLWVFLKFLKMCFYIAMHVFCWILCGCMIKYLYNLYYSFKEVTSFAQ